MNLVVERAPALSALSRIAGIVERRNVIPILSNVLLKADGGMLTMRATDLEMEVMESFLAEADDFSEITVPADKLHDIVRNADTGAQINLKPNDAGTRVGVKSGRSNFNLPALPSADFPKFEAADLDGGFTMPAKLLADMLSRVAWAAAPPPNQTVLSRIYFATVGDELHAVACSSSGIALRREARPAGAEISAIMPVKLASHVAKWLGEAEGDVRVACSKSLIRVEHGGSVLTSKLDGAAGYADYAKALIESQEAGATTDQDGVALALRRVMIMADGKTNSVRMSFSEGAVSLSARSDQSGEAADEISADYQGPNHDLLFSAGYLTSTLASLRGDVVEFGFHLTPNEKAHNTCKVIVRAPSDPAYTSIIMLSRA